MADHEPRDEAEDRVGDPAVFGDGDVGARCGRRDRDRPGAAEVLLLLGDAGHQAVRRIALQHVNRHVRGLRRLDDNGPDVGRGSLEPQGAARLVVPRQH